MINVQIFKVKRFVTFGLLAAAVMAINACTHTPLTPSQTVQHFWSALIEGDLNNARKYSTPESASSVEMLQSEFSTASVSFGQVKLESNQALIETTLTRNHQKNEPSTTTFNTVLTKHEDQWKVNYIATSKSLEDSQRKKGLSRLVDDLGKLGRDMSGQLDGVLKNWEEMTPKIKKDLEELGNSVQKELQDSIDKHGPEMQQKLQDFADSLEKAFKGLDESLPDSKKDNGQDNDEAGEQPKGRMI